jgi:hypothetical protein
MQRGRADTPKEIAAAAARIAERALALIAGDTEASYLANGERQLVIERLLIQFGEALKRFLAMFSTVSTLT